MEERLPLEESSADLHVTASGIRALGWWDRLAIALSGLLCAALALLALNEPWVSDDFSNALFIREHPGIFYALKQGYLTWSGRFTSSAFSWMAIQTRPVYGLVIWLGVLLLVVMTFALARGRLPRARRGDLTVLALLLVAYWYGMPALEETVFWASGSAVYLWPAVATLVFLYQYRRWEQRETVVRQRVPVAIASIVGMLLLGVWVGGAQEQVLAACLVYLGFVGGRALLAGRLRRLPAALYVGLAGLVIAGAISVVAPGNGARAAAAPEGGLLSTALGSGKYLVHTFVDWLPPIAPWLLCLALLAVPVVRATRQVKLAGDEERGTRSEWWLWLLLGLVTLSPLLVHPYFGAERTITYLAVFIAVAAVSLGTGGAADRVLDRLPAAAASAALCIVLLAALGDVALGAWQAGELKAGQEDRSRLVEEQKRDGVSDVRVPPITADEPRRGVIWGDGTADSAFWVNGILASYYEVGTFTVESPAE